MRGSVVIEPLVACSDHHQDVIILELFICIRLELTKPRSSIAKIKQLTAVLNRSRNRCQSVGDICPTGGAELRQTATAELIEDTESPYFNVVRDSTNALPVTDGASDDTRNKRSVSVLVKRKGI